ncbi:MAG: asparaginase [Phycisphaeraceae bacterium]|nr:asparaginase [Phycisphaeraceae bacterium]
MRHVTIITTGGTIEKTYDERTGALENTRSIIHRMLGRLRLEKTEVGVVELMSKDSLHMTDEDRARVLEAVRGALADEGTSGVVILHGTDTLEMTGDLLARSLGSIRMPVVLTGALRPYEMKRSDALQNLTEAMFAASALPPGVYCVAHGQALRFPGVRKNRDRGTFEGGS